MKWFEQQSSYHTYIRFCWALTLLWIHFNIRLIIVRKYLHETCNMHNENKLYFFMLLLFYSKCVYNRYGQIDRRIDSIWATSIDSLKISIYLNWFYCVLYTKKHEPLFSSETYIYLGNMGKNRCKKLIDSITSSIKSRYNSQSNRS